jgi:hypothetical protein
MRIEENEIVVLASDLPEGTLKTGDIGTIVFSYEDKTTFDVEFINFEGETISLQTLHSSQIRPISRNDIPHVRTNKVA